MDTARSARVLPWPTFIFWTNCFFSSLILSPGEPYAAKKAKGGPMIINDRGECWLFDRGWETDLVEEMTRTLEQCEPEVEITDLTDRQWVRDFGFTIGADGRPVFVDK